MATRMTRMTLIFADFPYAPSAKIRVIRVIRVAIINNCDISTMIGFSLPAAAAATLTVYDETGRVVFTQKGDFARGYNAISLDRALLNTTGVLYYTLETATDAATMKMIQAR